MIESIYIDNFKCFTNFEYQPGQVELILGDNGTGKSSMLDLLRRLKLIVAEGRNTQSVFFSNELSAWDTRRTQTFELGIKAAEGSYKYSLQVEHAERNDKNRITCESLRLDEKVLYRFDGSDAHLYKDDGSAGPTIPYDRNKSFIATIPERNDNRRLIAFRERLINTFSLSPNPLLMTAESQSEVEIPDQQLHNLSAWLRHLFQDDIDMMQAMRNSLQDVIAGMTTFKHEKTSQHSRSFQFQFDFSDDGSGEFWLPLNDLSDGQRQLVALYAIHVAMCKADRTVAIDEPDNFVALREIQPWLTASKDAVEDNHSQLWIVSHNPELIDYLAPSYGVQFYRDQGGPVRTKRFEWRSDEVIKPSEIVARGWE